MRSLDYWTAASSVSKILLGWCVHMIRMSQWLLHGEIFQTYWTVRRPRVMPEVYFIRDYWIWEFRHHLGCRTLAEEKDALAAQFSPKQTGHSPRRDGWVSCFKHQSFSVVWNMQKCKLSCTYNKHCWPIFKVCLCPVCILNLFACIFLFCNRGIKKPRPSIWKREHIFVLNIHEL